MDSDLGGTSIDTAMCETPSRTYGICFVFRVLFMFFHPSPSTIDVSFLCEIDIRRPEAKRKETASSEDRCNKMTITSFP